MGFLTQNEIRDFLLRAPRRSWRFTGCHLVNYEACRHLWFADLLKGTIDERINRRSGLKVFTPLQYAPWRGPYSAIKRNKRRELQRSGLRAFCHAHVAHF
jgi:hypothetical protein